MPTFAQLKTIVSRKLIDPNNTAISASDVGQAINDAIRFWRYRRFWFNESSTTLTMDINDPFVLGYGNTNSSYPLAPVLPSDFLEELPKDGFVIQYSNLSYTMNKVHPREYDNQNVRGQGLPYCYTWRNGNYEFYWYPNLAYTLSVYYFKNYVDLVSDNDNNDFTNLADQLVIYEALSRLSGEDRQDLEMNNSYAAKADREYSNLERRTFKKTASGKLSVDSILDNRAYY